ncbi:MAG: dCTP deaminase [Planctomycetes bacterium]|nr:dCTP deaminase [Planctomycetota bacterium]
MILSNIEIQKAIDEKRLVITPEPSPRRPGAEKCPYQTSAVDLRLGPEFALPTNEQPTAIDLRNGGYARLSDWVHCTASANTPFNLEPGTFVLAKTLERVGLPILEGQVPLAARVEGKSSYARCGMLVHFTAPTIHAGFEGTITLEIVNLGPKPINLYPNMYVCQLVVEEVKGTPFTNESQFQGQSVPTGTES